MALSNYSDLLASIALWANRSDLAGVIPDFIAMAEARMASDIVSKSLESVQSVPITAGVAELPDNVVSINGLRIAGATCPDVIVTSKEKLDSLTTAAYNGQQVYGAQIERTIHLYPVPAPIDPEPLAYLEVRAKVRIPSLRSNSTNWLMTNYPNVYLFGSLVELAGFLRDDAGVAMWEQKYSQAVAQANSSLSYGGQNVRASVWGVR